MVKKKAKSHRQTLKQKYKVQKRVKEHDRKLKKAQKRAAKFAAAEAAQENADALGAHAAPRRRPRVELKMDDYLSRCPSSYVVSHGQTPWLLRRQKRLYEEVAGSDDMAVELSRYGGSAVQPLTGARAEAQKRLQIGWAGPGHMNLRAKSLRAANAAKDDLAFKKASPNVGRSIKILHQGGANPQSPHKFYHDFVEFNLGRSHPLWVNPQVRELGGVGQRLPEHGERVAAGGGPVDGETLRVVAREGLEGRCRVPGWRRGRVA